MFQFDFAKRLSQLRNQKNVSARSMSLDIGQNPAYINNIENNHAQPSLDGIYYICEYLGVHPKDFFDDSLENPLKLDETINDLRKLSPEQLEHVSFIIKELIHKK